jgi:hypothetical protein
MVSCEELELGGVRDVAELVNTPHHARTDARRRTAVAVSAFVTVSRKVAVFLRSGVMTSVSLATYGSAETEINPRSLMSAL